MNKLKGFIKVARVDASGTVLAERPWQRNLITSDGMNRVGGDNWEACMRYGVAGDGSTGDADYPIRVPSSSTVAYQNGTTVTADASIFDALHEGWLIVWDNGPQAVITNYVSGTEVDVDLNQTVASGPFTLYRIDAAQLVSETDRMTSLVTGSVSCGYTLVGDELTLYRTWDAPLVTGTDRDYTEVGVSWDSTAGVNLFSRVNLDDAPFTVVVGQRLRLSYRLVITLSPAYVDAASAPTKSLSLAGVGVRTGKENRQKVGLALINSSGIATTDASDGGKCMEPSAIDSEFIHYISPNVSAIQNFGSDVDRSAGAVAGTVVIGAVSDLGGVHTVARTITFDNATAVGSSWRSIGVSHTTDSDGGVNNGYVFLFNAALSKSGTQTLEFTYVWTWSRSFE